MSRQAELVAILAEAMRSKVHEAGEVDRAQIATEAGMDPASPEYLNLWNAARLSLVPSGIDLQPTHKMKDGRGGLYRPADAVGTLRRAGRDLAAASKKTGRAKAKAESLKVEDLPADVQQSAKRMLDKTTQMQATGEVLRHRRRFDPPPPPERKPVIGVREFQDLIDRGARSIRASIENPNGEET